MDPTMSALSPTTWQMAKEESTTHQLYIMKAILDETVFMGKEVRLDPPTPSKESITTELKPMEFSVGLQIRMNTNILEPLTRILSMEWAH